MTSGISFRKISKEYRRHHMAEILLFVFFAFFHMLGFVIYLQNTLSDHTVLTAERRQILLNEIMEGIRPNIFTCLIVGLLGALTGILAFRFLHSKMKVDFYNALPIKKLEMYGLILVNTLLMFIIPVAVFLALECLITAMAGYFTTGIIMAAGLALLVHTAAFALCFLTQGMAMILTGNLLTGILGGCVFAFYSPLLLYGVINSYAETFFKTYAYDIGPRGFFVFSPMTLSLFMVKGGYSDFGPDPVYMAMTFFWIVALTLFAGWLFLIRPSEKAGSSMAFSKMKAPLRMVLVIPMSLFIGWAFYQITLKDSILWLVGGIIISVILSHGLIEAIYQMDVRGMWSHKKQMILTLVLTLTIAGIFCFDVFGYDSWLPAKDQLKTLEIVDDNMVGSYQDSDVNLDGLRSGLSGQDMDKAYDLLQRMVEKGDYGAARDDQDDTKYYKLTVTYHLKNGRSKKKSYDLPKDLCREDLDTLYGMEAFKKDNSVLYQLDHINADNIYIYMNVPGAPYGMESLEIKDSDREEFLKLYREDFGQLSFTQRCAEIPLGRIELSWREKMNPDAAGGLQGISGERAEHGEDVHQADYYIYPSFGKTLTWLKEKGYMDGLKSGYIIKQLDVSYYHSGEDGVEDSWDYTIKDREKIEELEPHLIPADLLDALSISPEADSMYDISIEAYYALGPEGYTVTMRTDKDTAKKLMESR